MAYETFYRVVLNYSRGDVEFGMEGTLVFDKFFSLPAALARHQSAPPHMVAGCIYARVQPRAISLRFPSVNRRWPLFSHLH